MARTKGSLNKFSVEKEAKKLQDKIESLVELSTSPETNTALLKAGVGISLHTLIRAASGDSTIEGISATNMISAANQLVAVGMKVLGEEAFKSLQQEAAKESKKTDPQIPPAQQALGDNIISFIGAYTEAKS